MKEVLQVAYLRHLQDFYLFESVKDGISISNERCTSTFSRQWGKLFFMNGSLTVA